MLHQRFIELGEGYGDVYELCELMKTNAARLHHAFIFAAPVTNGHALTLAAAFKPATVSNFMPIYVCREGIIQTDDIKSKRRRLFEEAAEQLGTTPIYIELKNSSEFSDRELFYQYVTGILRLNHLLPPLQ
ncbi:methylthioribose kinase [Sporosarcina sp. HYO08]|uniref:DUF7147 family protein n=1 Tax=Sporosarcina sp. HYO08 TaxID=1759557 RepID=UPI0007943E47|nr:methylthioribose kinase [Sporosarcina sp. HYO08]KXH79878.1 methylthioribose kinase [Sporosarcina sp. HYO08]